MLPRYVGRRLTIKADSSSHGGFCKLARDLASDKEEDPYVRLEAMAYRASLCGDSATKVFANSLKSADEQIQLETVIALGETATADAVECLCQILDDSQQPYFKRSAADVVMVIC